MVQEGELAIRPDSEVPESPAMDLPAAIEPDSIVSEPAPVYGVVLTPPDSVSPASLRSGGENSVSYILGALFILFLIIALRFRHNIKYAMTIFHNLMETRTRHNVFDDTVRETSLIVMLNILWCAGAGIMAFCLYEYIYPEEAPWNLRGIGMLWGMAVAAVYSLFMWGAYGAVGWVFSDRSHAELWVKGYASSQALMAPAFFLAALVAICRPEAAPGAAMVGAVVFILAKLAFIWKGYRIFFNQFSSWVLFLCYLCSLEIVPLILCYRLALLLDRML